MCVCVCVCVNAMCKCCVSMYTQVYIHILSLCLLIEIDIYIHIHIYVCINTQVYKLIYAKYIHPLIFIYVIFISLLLFFSSARSRRGGLVHSYTTS